MPSDADLVPDLCAFLEASPTPYHAAAEVAARLEAAGFSKLEERDAWHLEPGFRGYLLRSGSLVAFALGSESPADAGFVMLGAHTDSPNLRLKPNPVFSRAGYRGLAVEVYGGVLLSTWLDRDLGLAGRLVLAGGQRLLVRLDGAVCSIPNLAIHLNREVNKAGLVLNPETHLTPIAGLDGDRALGFDELLERLLSGTVAAGARPSDVVGFDLCLFDTQKPALGGARGELLHSARLDNLVSCHAGCRALVQAGAPGRATRVLALYDHEEVGSESAFGARSELVETVLERLMIAYPNAGPEATARAAARSLLVSADMAHAVHPNYADKHDERHRPLLGKGLVIKVNQNQSYATDGIVQGAFVEACRAEGVTPQYFTSRNDMACGSTIGPIAAARLGVRTIDVGGPMLAMHSCRETAGTGDLEPISRVFRRLFGEPPPFAHG